MSPLPAGPHKLITCILPKGKGPSVLQALFDRKVLRAALGSARAPVPIETGRGAFRRTAYHSVEKDILTVIVAPEQAEEVFAFVHEQAGIGELYGGFLFMGPLSQASRFVLPADLPPA